MTRAGRVVVLRALALLMVLGSSATAAHAFGLDDVAARTEKLAAAPYQKPSASLPKAIKALGYDSSSMSISRAPHSPGYPRRAA